MPTWTRKKKEEEDLETPDLQIFGGDEHPNPNFTKYSGSSSTSTSRPITSSSSSSIPERRWSSFFSSTSWEWRRIFKEYEKIGLILLLSILTVSVASLVFILSVENHVTTNEIRLLQEQIKEFKLLQNTMEQRQEKSQRMIEQVVKNQTNALEKPQVPLGFIYVQLSGQLAPNFLFPHMNWTEITSLYAGQFFRAVGGHSAPFGQLQEASAPRITRIAFADHDLHPEFINLPVGAQSEFIHSGSYTHDEDHVGLSFTTSADEVRPFNSAVRIWKRTP